MVALVALVRSVDDALARFAAGRVWCVSPKHLRQDKSAVLLPFPTLDESPCHGLSFLLSVFEGTGKQVVFQSILKPHALQISRLLLSGTLTSSSATT